MRRVSLEAVVVFIIAFAWLIIPQFHKFNSFQMPWHDFGHNYSIILNLFERRQFYSYDYGFDNMNVHVTPLFYVLAVLFFYLAT